MGQVLEGNLDPRRPPSVRLEEDGSFTVLDGRSGITAAIHHGYKQIPVRVIDRVRDEDGNVVKTTPAIEEFYLKAARTKDHFDKRMENFALQHGGIWKDTDLKGRKRAMWKVENEYKGDPNELKDILRGTISVNTLADVASVHHAIVNEFKPIKNKMDVLEISGVNLNGYKDVNLVFEFEGVKVEVQINTRAMLVAKHFGHGIYGAYRESNDRQMIKALVDIEKKLYRDAYAQTRYRGAEGTVDQALGVVRARVNDVAEANERYGLSINFTKSDLDTILPLWAAEPGGNFLGGSVSHAKQAVASSSISRSSVTGTPSTDKSSVVSGSDLKSGLIDFTSTDSVTQPELKRIWEQGPGLVQEMKNVGGALMDFKGLFYAPNNRGQIQFTGEGGLITLLEDADLSTFLHESGHFFFEAYKVLAKENDAIRADMDALLAYVGVDSLTTWENMSLEERREGHEKVARAFETYLFEGEAPSLEMQGLFDTFKSWLLQVYKNMRGLNVNLTDEVRGVFDRMLATEEQIRARQVANGYRPLFESAEESGMTPAQWQQYQDLNQNQQRASQSALEQRSLKDMQWLDNARSRLLKEMQADHKAKRKTMKAEVAEEVRKEPVYYAMHFLRTGETVDADGNPATIEHHKLDRDEYREKYPNLTLPRNMTAKDGVPHDMMAELLGWSSGDELVQGILKAEPQQERVDRLTDQRMLETYGDIANPEKMAQAVEEAVHSEAHTRFLHTELKHLTKASGVGNVLARAAKAFAQQAMQRKKVKDIKPHQYSLAEGRAGRNAEQALRQGDRESAAEHKRAQVLNTHFFRAANNARKDIEKTIRYFKKFNRDGTRKNLDVDYLDQIDKLLEAYDFRQVSQKKIDKRKALAEWVKQQEDMGFSPLIDERLLADTKKQHYRETPVEELMGLYDTVKNIEHLGRLKKTLLRRQEQANLDEAADTVGSSIRNFSSGKNKVKIEHNSWTDRIKKGTKEFFAFHRKFPSIARQMDGLKDRGPVWEFFIRPLNESADMEAVEREKATLIMDEIFEPVQKMKLREKVHIPAINNSLSLEGRLMIALNQGNELNRRRVMTGDGWNEQQVGAILDTLTQEQWDFVQGVWNYIDSYWEQIAAKEKRVSGVVPQKVERIPVLTKFGEYEGGYFPIMYDVERSTRSREHDESEHAKQMMQGTFTRASTRRGHTKERFEGDINRPVRKDFGGIFQHVDQVIHDLSYHEWLIDANRLLSHSEVDAAIRESYGPEILKAMRDTIKDVAVGDMGARNSFEASVNHIRTGATIAGMGFSLWTSALQPLGLAQSIVRIGPKWVGRGIAEFIGSAVKMENALKNIHEKSSFMRLRAKTMQREINEIRNKVSSGGKVSNLESGYFYLIMRAQQIADIPTWLGQYHKSVADGADEKSAVAAADQAVIDSQGGGQIKDQAGVQRGSPLLKLWTNFYSYFNVTMNMTAESASRVRGVKDLPRFAVDMLMLYTVPATLSALMREVLRGDCDDEECVLEAVVSENLGYMLGTVVGVRELSSAASGFYGYSGPPGARFFSEASKLTGQAMQGDMDRGMWKALNQTMGVLFHYPASQLQRTVEGVIAIQEGDVEGADAVLAPMFGPPR